MTAPNEENGGEKQIPLPLPPTLTPQVVSAPTTATATATATPTPTTTTAVKSDENNKRPWIQLGELDPKTSLTPPPEPVPGDVGAEERARMRFRVVGGAVCMFPLRFSFAFAVFSCVCVVFEAVGFFRGGWPTVDYVLYS